MPEGGALLVGETGMQEVLHQVELFPGAKDDIGFPRHQGVIDG